MTVHPPDGLHTTDQAAEVLGVPAGVIRSWRHTRRALPAGALPAAAPGGHVLLWRLSELEPLAQAYLARKARKAARHADVTTSS
ncbi:hypothetical protein GCM10022215_29870 [Nocardioides fonticola]|uniref:Helix-turn-helix domain-containing protein n=1 Tax=Nocardioides fonticola TaxID=450363 RepID=A0ABP7XPN2_9ACTN